MNVELNPIWSGYAKAGLDIKEENIEFRNVKEECFSVHGLWNVKENFRRLPDDIANSISSGVADKAKAPAGARVRFATDSDVIGIRVKFQYKVVVGPHITRLTDTGFDVYCDDKNGVSKFLCVFYPALDGFDGYEGIRTLPDNSFREFTVHLPLTNEVYELEIVVRKGSTIRKPRPYRNEKPVLFYGSSITHGLCASRPGNCYPNIISRHLDTDTICLGFSGQAMGEANMAKYIAGLDLSAFVMDYDHNAPNLEHLKKTHEPFFKIVRELKPELPIVIVTRPCAKIDENTLARKDIIMQTYLNARNSGDKNVYFVDGYNHFRGLDRTECTCDGTHPNDFGFFGMAENIGSVLNDIL